MCEGSGIATKERRMPESAWWVNQFFLYFFGGMGVFFVGVGVLWGVSIWSKKDREEPAEN